MVSFDLGGRVALVTGGTKGIGLGIVRQLLKAGASVALSSRNGDECTAVAGQLSRDLAAQGRVSGHAGDLADPASLRALVASVLDRWGRVDCLVANAADTGSPSPAADISLERFARVLQSNVANNFDLARHVAPDMLGRRDGSIIFISSIAASTPMPSNIPYASAKAALTSVARSLAAEYVTSGVRVNCVAPGLIRSAASMSTFSDPALLARYVRSHVPMNRIGEAEEIGAACVFLASSAGAYVTGAVIPVDGGRAGLGQLTGGPEIVYGDNRTLEDI